MRKRRLSKALAMFLAAALTIPAAVPVAASESTADKEETVYVKTDANGEEKTVIVSDWLKNFSGEAKIKDATDLTDVENVKGNETYKRGKKDSITWNANGKDIYYQGTSDKNLPVSMKVTYYLDGKEISPKKLVGKSGKVKIRYEYENHSAVTKTINGKQTTVYTPFTMITAAKFGAQGIGLCRTEHMFFDAERIPKIRRMILSTTKEAREIALNQLIPYQKKDFKDLYEVMEGRPVTIRFLDPPLHEFLPNTMEEITALAKDMGVTVEEINMRRAALHEFNPMMGHRGCRLAVTYPEIAKMQTRAVMEAAIEVKQEKGYDIVPEIMIPLVGEKKELAYVKEVVVQTAEKVKAYYESDIKYKVGTMIEIPRAALLADEIAEEAEFFSFGTNDLTQMTFGFSRDDAGKFLESYYENKIYESDPFAKLDQKGVGQLIEMAAKKGKATRPDIHLGICGEHGGDPSSVEFCYRAGLDYVSCSPFRVPIARLAAAQAVLKDK